MSVNKCDYIISLEVEGKPKFCEKPVVSWQLVNGYLHHFCSDHEDCYSDQFTIIKLTQDEILVWTILHE